MADWRKRTGRVGGAIGGYFGGLQGARVGKNIGRWGYDAIGLVTGFGDYQVKSNALYEGAQIPYVRNESLYNGTCISHREYIGELITSSVAGNFKIQTFEINPGLASLFEWLAQIANNYEEYVFEGLLFMFRSMSADALNSTNTALGSVIMATQYNVYNENFTSKAEMEAHEYGMSGRPANDMVHPIECDWFQGGQRVMNTRAGTYPADSDHRLFDVGKWSVATVGFQSTSVNIGELWVSYQVCLMKPRLFAALGLANDFYYHRATDAAPATIVGTNFTNLDNNTITLTFVNAVNQTTISLPTYPMPTTYLFSIHWNSGGASTACGASSVGTFINCVNITSLGWGINNAPGNLQVAQGAHTRFIIKYLGGNTPSSFILTNGSQLHNVCEFICTQIRQLS